MLIPFNLLGTAMTKPLYGSANPKSLVAEPQNGRESFLDMRANQGLFFLPQNG
jgi:hypothetical protein